MKTRAKGRHNSSKPSLGEEENQDLTFREKKKSYGWKSSTTTKRIDRVERETEGRIL